MQDLNYTFDAVGNITEQVDNAQQTQYFSNSVIDPANKYRYDSLYRLIQATGREKGNLSAPNSSGYQPDWIPTNGKSSQSLATYCEEYSYDEVGNILELAHKDTCGGTENWKRSYVYNNNIINNYLLSAYTGSTPPSSPQFTYDAHGNMLQMPHLQAMNWDFADQMKSSQKTGETSYYEYSGGERVRKIVVDTSGSTEKIKYERIYFGEYEVYHKYNTTGELETETLTHHVKDESLAMVLQEVKTVNGGSPIENPITISRYQYGDQLDSAKLELNQSAEVLSYEEYHPFGTTSFEMHTNDSEVSLKRYKYVHNERDSETGLYYYGARYYAAWLGRFTACDPKANEYLEWSPYNYTLDNPVKYIDPDGKEPIKGKVAGLIEYIKMLSNQRVMSLSGLRTIYSNKWHSAAYGNSSNSDSNRDKRYLYSERWGWVDMKHFSAAADGTDYFFYTAKKVLSKGESIEQEQLKRGSGSAYSYEDLPSNLLGVYFEEWLEKDDTSIGEVVKMRRELGIENLEIFQLQLYKFLKELGFVNNPKSCLLYTSDAADE